MLTITDRASFTSIINDNMSAECMDFKMFCNTIVSLFLIHTLAVDLKSSLGDAYPKDSAGEVDERLAEVNYSTAVSKHDAMYKDEEVTLPRNYETWESDKTVHSVKVQTALNAIADSDGALQRVRTELYNTSNSGKLRTKKEVATWIKNWFNNNYPMVFSFTIPSQSTFNSLGLNGKKRKGSSRDDVSEVEGLGGEAELVARSHMYLIKDR